MNLYFLSDNTSLNLEYQMPIFRSQKANKKSEGKSISMVMTPENDLSDKELDELATMNAELRDIDAAGLQRTKEAEESDWRVNIRREFRPVNKFAAVPAGTRLIETDRVQLDGIVALGKPIDFIPGRLASTVMLTLCQLVDDVHKAVGIDQIELKCKKLLLAPTVLFIDGSMGQSRADNWDEFTLGSFTGRQRNISQILNKATGCSHSLKGLRPGTTTTPLNAAKESFQRCSHSSRKGRSGEHSTQWRVILSRSKGEQQPSTFWIQSSPRPSQEERWGMAIIGQQCTGDEVQIKTAVANLPPTGGEDFQTFVLKAAGATKHGTDNLSIDLLK